MHVINLFGGPGIGKSTTAAEIFSLLKKAGVNAEYVHEEAKEFTWEKRMKTLECQPYVFGKQYRNLWRLQDQVEVAVTDSPLLLSLVYTDLDRYPGAYHIFRQYVLDLFETFNNWNVVLRREKKYNPSGRNQTEDEAKKIDGEIQKVLTECNQTFTDHGHDCAKPILDVFTTYLQNKKLKKHLTDAGFGV